MASSNLDRLDAAGEHPAFIREDDLGRSAARGERLMVHGVEDAVVAIDRFDLHRPRLVTVCPVVAVGNGLDRGDVITQPLGTGAQMVFGGGTDRCQGTSPRPSPVDAVGQMLRVEGNGPVPASGDRRQSVQEIGVTDIIRVGERGRAEILDRNHGQFDLLSRQLIEKVVATARGLLQTATQTN